jgi:hypothetical protein
MKGCARLILFFVITFIMIAVAGTVARLGYAWVSVLGAEPAVAFRLAPRILAAASDQFMLAVFAAALLGANYAARRRVGRWLSGLTLFALISGAAFGGAWALAAVARLLPDDAVIQPPAISAEGQIMAYPGATVVKVGGGRIVVARPGAPLRTAAAADVSALSGDSARSFLSDGLAPPPSLVAVDRGLRAIGARFAVLASGGTLALAINAAGLASLLAVLRVLAGATVWPLADLVIGMAGLSAIALLDGFLRSPTPLRILDGLLPMLPAETAVPVLMAGLAALVALGTGLAYLAGGRKARRG